MNLSKPIAVVILNWNGAAMLRRFLPSVVAHSSAEAEVIVADNGSTDDSLQLLRDDFPSVRVLTLDRNYGFTGGYNRALAQIGAKYLLLLNSDVEVTPAWLRPLLDYMDAHPEVAACQPKLRAQRRPEEFEYAGAAGGYLDRYGYPFCRGRAFSMIERDGGQYDDIRSVFWATGAALMIRRADWLSAGGLDERFFAHMEEIDLCWRLNARGRKVVCIPQSVVYHVGGGTLAMEHPRKTFLNFRNNLLMLYKNLPAADLRPVMRRRRCLDYIAALKYLLTGHAANARAVVQARREFKRLRPTFTAQREENLRRAVVQTIPQQLSGSLLYLFYFKGCKRFDCLRRFFPAEADR